MLPPCVHLLPISAVAAAAVARHAVVVAVVVQAGNLIEDETFLNTVPLL